MARTTKKPETLEAGTADERAEAAYAAVFRRQILFWLGFAALFVLFLLIFRSILLPFVAGMALAYFLDPVADRLEATGLSRAAATSVILAGFVLAFALSLIILLPILANQFAAFASAIPGYVSRLQHFITSFDTTWLERLGISAESLRSSLNGLLTQGAQFLTSLLQSLWSSGKALVDIVSLFVVTPVVAFYMLLDWDRMIAKVDSWVPRDYVPTVRRLAIDINAVTAGFVRGQGTLCLVLGVFYATGLTLLGLNFGLLIGLFAGLISFIPYVGSIIGLGLSLAVAAVQFWPDWWPVVVAAVIFFSGQFMEGNILQPRLVGKSVGLHPVWLMFALFAFGALFGFVGLLVAVPSAAAVGVLVRFAIERYLDSPLYKGHGTNAKTGA
ncbi:MAG: AI-2E family transporter [Rhizobiaceae bacterium]